MKELDIFIFLEVEQIRSFCRILIRIFAKYVHFCSTSKFARIADKLVHVEHFLAHQFFLLDAFVPSVERPDARPITADHPTCTSALFLYFDMSETIAAVVERIICAALPRSSPVLFGGFPFF